MEGGGLSGGTGEKLTHATIIVAGVASIVASLLSVVSIWFQTYAFSHFQKPETPERLTVDKKKLPQTPFTTLCRANIAHGSDLLDIIMVKYRFFESGYAFTIYTFFQLLINFIGGERALIIMMHGREPVHHLWPMNHFLPKVDISDPHSFLAIKRGILQYAWLKPVLGIATIIMKATGVYREGVLALTSGYMWTGIFYNVSVTLSLYSLGMFWVCMSKDLQPFRPVPKFLCIKLIIFASYWQGFFLSILVWLGAIPDNVEGYTSDNLAAAIQDALICMEMPIFAVAHWYAFSWHDYADDSISAARMPVWYAVRDSFGIRDLIEDTKETFSGNKYEYRLFDSGDNVLAHEGSSSRVARMMEGMRYERGGKGKYWIPKPGAANSRTPLLRNNESPSRPRSLSPTKSAQNDAQYMGYGDGSVENQVLDPEEEHLYERARRLEYGDWNASWHPLAKEALLILLVSCYHGTPRFTPEMVECIPRPSDDVCESKHSSSSKKGGGSSKGKQKAVPNGEEGRAPALKGMLRHHSSASSSAKSDRSQLVDLVVEDATAENAERVRARKEGSAAWNETDQKHFVRTYGSDTGEDIREGHEPAGGSALNNPNEDQETNPFAVGDGEDDEENSEESRHWKQASEPEVLPKPKYGLEGEAFENVWGGGDPSGSASENP
ncbi:hypothetical protein G7Y89_g6734 [Cudoniella acicularis]|uniref:Transmembrane protein 34 n=1 Tax=Cudoniella acicularis TaxID=354080 RepID=A0A8H4RJV6_9HELO|nr:hypothetical protein G7Y89_g6734 [Cudoniella acicularis]